MKLAIRANESLKSELLEQGFSGPAEIHWVDELRIVAGADAYIDLLFETDHNSLESITRLGEPLVIVNSVCKTSGELPGNIIRINGWPTFLRRPVTEAASSNSSSRAKAE